MSNRAQNEPASSLNRRYSVHKPELLKQWSPKINLIFSWIIQPKKTQCIVPHLVFPTPPATTGVELQQLAQPPQATSDYQESPRTCIALSDYSELLRIRTVSSTPQIYTGSLGVYNEFSLSAWAAIPAAWSQYSLTAYPWLMQIWDYVPVKEKSIIFFRAKRFARTGFAISNESRRSRSTTWRICFVESLW